MARKYKARRVKLKRHDQGYDRHNKGVAYEMKQKRRAAEHEGERSQRRKRHK